MNNLTRVWFFKMGDVSLINNETKLKYNRQIVSNNLYYHILLVNKIFRVSSVLNRDTKSYGRQFLCDGKEETCWNSDQVKRINHVENGPNI